MILYSLRTSDSGFSLAKFDNDFNVAAIYELRPKGHHGYSCSCPAGSARVIVKPCKHIKALRVMEPKVDTDEFYCFETASWHRPIAHVGQADNMDMTFEPSLPLEADARQPVLETASNEIPNNVVSLTIVPPTEAVSETKPAPTLRRRI